jgi:hypothetical protein
MGINISTYVDMSTCALRRGRAVALRCSFGGQLVVTRFEVARHLCKRGRSPPQRLLGRDFLLLRSGEPRCKGVSGQSLAAEAILERSERVLPRDRRRTCGPDRVRETLDSPGLGGCGRVQPDDDVVPAELRSGREPDSELRGGSLRSNWLTVRPPSRPAGAPASGCRPRA